VLQKKNDNRDASSQSVMRYGVPAATLAGSASGRNTNDGLASMRRSASCTPRVNIPSFRPRS
jgi:hypothetical protein